MKLKQGFRYFVFSILLLSQMSSSAYAVPNFYQCIVRAAGLYFGSIAACDAAQLGLGIQVGRDQTTRTAACYDWFQIYLKEGYDKGGERDYSEGLFDFENKPNMTLAEATLNKYEYIFNKLELKPGMTLLDAGCGTGVWMEFCAARGVKVIGLTLSEEQAKVVRSKGLEVHVADYRKKNEGFLGKFDRITALGSSEHVCSSLGSLRGDGAAVRCNQARIDTWSLFRRYLKSDGKFYVTLLTVNKDSKWTPKDWLQAYILERHYGGYYSTMEDIAKKVVPDTGLHMTDLQDKTRDYHWSSIIDKDHFGNWKINWQENRVQKIKYLLKGIVTDPYLLHHWLYYYMNTWMWQFGGYQEKPLTEEQIQSAPMQLKYFMLEPIIRPRL